MNEKTSAHAEKLYLFQSAILVTNVSNVIPADLESVTEHTMIIVIIIDTVIVKMPRIIANARIAV